MRNFKLTDAGAQLKSHHESRRDAGGLMGGRVSRQFRKDRSINWKKWLTSHSAPATLSLAGAYRHFFGELALVHFFTRGKQIIAWRTVAQRHVFPIPLMH
jgi:hypothetical protein